MNLIATSPFRIVQVEGDPVLHLAHQGEQQTLCDKPVSHATMIPESCFVPGGGDPEFSFCVQCDKRRRLKGGVGS
jgi:hypothetical protein